MKNTVKFQCKLRIMSKIHTKTGSICAVCDEVCSPTSVVLHKTRRQTHRLCQDCAVGYLSSKLQQITENLRKNIKTREITCCGTYHSNPRNRCSKKIGISLISCGYESSIHIDLFRIQYILQNDGVYLCPSKECGQIIEIDENIVIPKMFCPTCKTTWCRTCLVCQYHENMSCIEYEASEHKSENGKLIWQLKADGKLNFCPRCKVPTMKNSGCNKMWCVTCDCKWCWLCRKVDIDYDHFNSQREGSCANRLWEGTDLDL